MNLDNTQVLEAETKKALEEYEANFKKLGEILNKAVDTIVDTTEKYRKIKEISVELKEFNDKILYLSGENPNNYPYTRAKGPDPYYVPPTDSTGDADYLKEVPEKLTNFNK